MRPRANESVNECQEATRGEMCVSVWKFDVRQEYVHYFTSVPSHMFCPRAGAPEWHGFTWSSYTRAENCDCENHSKAAVCWSEQFVRFNIEATFRFRWQKKGKMQNHTVLLIYSSMVSNWVRHKCTVCGTRMSSRARFFIHVARYNALPLFRLGRRGRQLERLTSLSLQCGNWWSWRSQVTSLQTPQSHKALEATWQTTSARFLSPVSYFIVFILHFIYFLLSLK